MINLASIDHNINKIIMVFQKVLNNNNIEELATEEVFLLTEDDYSPQ